MGKYERPFNLKLDYNSKEFSDALYNFLFDNGLLLESGETGKSIKVGMGGKDWMVCDTGELDGKEYSTLKGAIKSANSFYPPSP